MEDFFSLERFFDNIPKILPYLLVTFKIVLYATLFGTLLGLVVALIRINRIPILNQLTGIYVSFMRGTPMLVQMLVIFYGLPILIENLLGVDINRWDKIIFVYITYALNQGAFLSEIFRSSILSIPVGQSEAGYSVGLTRLQTFRRIVLPQAARVAVPSFGADLIGLFHGTSLAFLIGVVDVMGRAKTIGNATKHVLEAYTIIVIIFITISLILKGLFFLLDRRLSYGK
jgi:L-cystine transport system permease protein